MPSYQLVWSLLLALAWMRGAEATAFAQAAAPYQLFARTNLVVWCIVPFDAKHRGPAERAEMLARLGIGKVAYDWREPHVPTFEQEILEYRKQGLEYFAFWDTHDKAFELFKKHGLHPQIWLTAPGPEAPTRGEQVRKAAAQLLPVVERTRRAGCRLGLYNHGGWGGEPENLVAVCEYLRQHHDAAHVGIVYNFHHGHDHIDDWARSLDRMKPYLLCLNINGMIPNGDKQGKLILTLAQGNKELAMLRVVEQSGWNGPIGILCHRDDADAGLVLADNLDGLEWLKKALAKPGSGGGPSRGNAHRPALRGDMNDPLHLTRRQFLQNTGKAATTLAAASAFAPALLAAKSPNETIGVGCIGLGTRGGDIINEVAGAQGVKVVAVCDVYGPHRQKGIERSRNPDVKAYVDYRELLADKNVDVVTIGTPDHWHCQMVLDAAKAGKDIFCEQGFSHTLLDAKLMRAAIKEKQIVFQLGHHYRASTAALQAKELIAQGILGPITLVRTGRWMVNDPARPMWRWYGYYGQWNRPDPAQVVKEVNWDLWLGSAPRIPWDERHFWHWRCYWAYGTGQAGDLLSHEMDIVQYVLGHGIPDTCYCAGLNALLKDDRETPDTWMATYQFEKPGRTVTFTGSMNTSAGNTEQPPEICGKDATLHFFNGVSDFKIKPN